MPITLNPACPLFGLRFGNKPLLELHIRQDHRQRVPGAQNGHRDRGSTRAAVPRHDSPADGHDLAFTPSRTTKEATAMTGRRPPRGGRAMTALRRARCALRNVNDEPPRASEAVICPARAPQPRPQAPVSPGGKPGKARRRTAVERADREDCLICRASVSF
jgi:hypothetical protein